MKKFLIALAAVSMIATPAMARDHRHYERHRGDRTGAVVAGVIGGVVLGAILSDRSDRRDRDDRYYRDYNRIPYEEQRLREIDAYNRYWTQPQRTCVEVRYVDYYGRVTSRYECR
jgi:hypothetical protein